MADIDYAAANQIVDYHITRLLDTLVNNLPIIRADAVRLVAQRIEQKAASYTLGPIYRDLSEKG